MSKTCFVIAPLGEEGSEVRQRADDLLTLLVRPALEPLDYELMRVDRLAGPGLITRDIIQLLFDADLVVADLSDSNPNVMYELGVRHSIGKPVVLLASYGTSLPFDVAGIRTIIYRLSSRGDMHDAIESLRTFVRAIEAERVADSPVLDTLAYRKFRSSSTNETRPEETSQQNAVLKTIVERLGTLEARLNQFADAGTVDKERPRYTRDVFIVHGHDGELKNELARFLEKIEFNPIILHEQADKGQTIIQKLQYEGSRVGYAFILHTPDDEGRKFGDTEWSRRSRQNVVFEHGMFVGRFSHSRVCAIVRHGVEIPSDLSGIVYKTIPAGGNIQSIAYDLIKELRAADYVIDANRI